MGASLANGVDKMRLPWAVEALPALIHLSLFLFFAGLIIFLFNINHSVFVCVITWIALFTAVYVSVTVMPIFWPNCPYFTPLFSVLAWSLHAFFSYALYGVLASITTDGFGNLGISTHFCQLSQQRRRQISWGMWKTTRKTLSKQSLETDGLILKQTMLGALREDDTLEQFFGAIPGFLNSWMVKNLKGSLPDKVLSKFLNSLGGFFARSLSSDSVSEKIKIRRLAICMNAAAAICDSDDTERTVWHFFHQRFDQVPPSLQTAKILAPWFAGTERCSPQGLQVALAKLLLLFVRVRDDSWVALVQDQFGLPKHVLRENIARGDNSVLLAILNYMTPQVLQLDRRSDDYRRSLDILSSLSNFDLRNAHHGLQNEFCALWNETIVVAKSRQYPYAEVLRAIRQVYVALHQGTDATLLDQPSSYLLCDIDGHHPHSAVPRPTQPIPGSSAAPQQAEEAHVISELRALPGQESSSPSSKSNPVHGPPQAMVSSIHEFMQTFGPDLNRLVSSLSMLVSLLSDQSSLSTANLTTKIGRNDEPTPDIRIKVQSSQTPTATLLTGTFHQHHQVDTVPVTVTPSIIAHPPSVSVEQQGELSDTPQPIASDLTFFHFLVPHKRQDTTVSQAGSDVTLVSSNATQIHPSISIASVTLQTSEELTGVPPTTVSDPQSSLIVALPTTSSVIPTEPPPSVESTVVQLDPLSHPFGSLPSTLTTAHSQVAPQVPGPSVLDVPVTRSIGGLGSHGQHETCDPNPPAPTDSSLRVQQTGSSTREA